MAIVDISKIAVPMHCTREITTSNDGKTMKVTYVGFQDPIFELNNSLKIGDIDWEWGRLNTKKITQKEGPHWLLTLEWEIEFDDKDGDSSEGNGNSRPKGTSRQPTTSSLNCTMMSVPIEMHPNYRMRWTNFLYCKYDLYGNSPDVTQDLKTRLQAWVTAHRNDQVDINPDEKIDLGTGYGGNVNVSTIFKWVKNPSAVPYDKNGRNTWHMAIKKLKPGLEKFDMPIYTLTEYSYHSNWSYASWVVTSRAGKIAYPINGDFGIDQRLGGNWLCRNGSIKFDGKYWIAELQYAHSGDYLLASTIPRYRGWDPQIYLFFNQSFNYNTWFNNAATSLSGFNDWDEVQTSNKTEYEQKQIIDSNNAADEEMRRQILGENTEQ